MDLKHYVISFLLVALFFFSIFTFLTTFIYDNQDIENLSLEYIGLNDIEQQLAESNENAEGWRQSLEQENPVLSFGALVLFSIWGVGKLIIGSVVTVYSIVIGGLSHILGIPALVTGVITAILLISLIFAIWKMIKTGK